MNIDVFMSPNEMSAGDTQGRVVAVIDVGVGDLNCGGGFSYSRCRLVVDIQSILKLLWLAWW